jgi:pulcherriminic acid synthase
VTLLLSSANGDPRRFDEPDRFDIHRADNAVSKAFTGNADHVGFGGGCHVCLGARLSKREVEIALNLVLDHGTDFRLVPGLRAATD